MTTRRKAGTLTAVVAFALLLAACSSSSGSSANDSNSGSTGSEPKEVTIAAVQDLTGPAGLAGKQLLAGMQFEVDQFNEQQGPGGLNVKLKVYDTRSDQQQAVNAATQAAGSDAIAILGPALSNEGLAIAPIAQRSRVPYVATQENAKGIPETGNYIFRTTAPQDTYQALTTKYLGQQKIKKAVLVYASNVATNVQWAGKTMPPLLDAEGIKIEDSIKITTTDTDFGSVVSKVSADKPDAVGISTVGAQNSTIITQLRRGGFQGLIFGQAGFSGGSLKGAGALANGAVWATDFNAQTKASVGAKFVSDWKAAHGGAAPNNFNAEGFDGALLLTKGLTQAKEVSRVALRDAMDSVASGGLDATVGHITFVNRDAKIDGVLVKWEDGAEVPLGGSD